MWGFSMMLADAHFRGRTHREDTLHNMLTQPKTEEVQKSAG